MKNIFSLFGKKSKSVAKDRLKLVLVHDRAQISASLLKNLQHDIIQVIKKYVDIDEEAFSVSFSDNRDSATLLANIPIKNLKQVKYTK